MVLRRVGRRFGERKSPEDGGGEENRARRPPPVRRGQVFAGRKGSVQERDRSAGGAGRTFREVTVVTGAGATPGKLASSPA